MAEPRVKWGQIIVEKVDRLDHRMDRFEHRVDQLALAVEGLARQSEKHDGQLQDISQRSTNTAAVVRWSATVITITLPLLITGAAWLTWHTAGLTERVEQTTQALAALSRQTERNTEALAELRAEIRDGFTQLESQRKTEPTGSD